MNIAFTAVARAMDENEAYLLTYSRNGYLVGSVLGSWNTELRRSLAVSFLTPESMERWTRHPAVIHHRILCQDALR